MQAGLLASATTSFMAKFLLLSFFFFFLVRFGRGCLHILLSSKIFGVLGGIKKSGING